MRICLDLDGTINYTKTVDEEYKDVIPTKDVVETIQKLKADGHYIIISTARNMAHFSNNVGKITAFQVPVIIEWLNRYEIPFDELFVQKPLADVYIDDKALKFKDNWKEIYELINNGEIK